MGKSKIITYVAVAVLILVGIYWAYRMINKPSEAPMAGVVAVSNTGGVISSQTDQASQFVSILNDIDDIDLKNHLILTNKIFTSLKDFGRDIEERTMGRENPFAPLGGGSGTVVNKATSTTLDLEDTPTVEVAPDQGADENIL